VTDPAPKPCARCGKEKDPSAFRVIPNNAPGSRRLHSWCRTCERIADWLNRKEGKRAASYRAYLARPDVKAHRAELERRRYWRKKRTG
jgi:hypothetical protein